MDKLNLKLKTQHKKKIHDDAIHPEYHQVIRVRICLLLDRGHLSVICGMLFNSLSFFWIQNLNLDMAKLTIFSIPFIDILMFPFRTYWFYGAILFMMCPSYVVKKFLLELILVLGVWQSLIFKISHLQMSNYSRSIYLKVLPIKLDSATFIKNS